MREKQLRFVVTYFTTAEAMATEQICKQKGIAGKLISAPRKLSADCGIAFATDLACKEVLVAALEEKGIEVHGYHEIFI